MKNKNAKDPNVEKAWLSPESKKMRISIGVPAFEKIQSTWKTQRHSQQWGISSHALINEKFSKCIFFAEDFKLFAKFDQIQTHTFGEISGFQISPGRGLSNCRIFSCFLMEGSKIDVIFLGRLPCLISRR